LHIDLDAVRHNLRFFRSHLPTGTGLVPMLKAAGYGSGGWQLAAALEAEGIAAIGVAYTGEGIVLRTHGIRSRILVLNADFESLDQLHGYGLEPAVWSIELLHALGRLNQPLHIHLEFDTGMARLGFLPQELPAIFEALAQYPLLQPVGLFSHLAAADDPAHDAFTHQQIATFTTLTAALQVPYPGLVTHLANTAGMLRFPTATGSWARLGLGLYGLAPIADYQGYLQEAATLRTAVSQVRHYPAGTSIGYSRSQVLATPATIATLPVGYADGYPRNLSNGKGNVLLQGVRCPIVGRVCMDMLMVDVSATPTPVRPGDEAVLFGTQLGQHLSVQEIADAAGTIPYEILAGMSQRIRRVFGRE
jgi:alanine racemase